MRLRTEILPGLLWFAGLGCLGASLGLTDDEAYYWVLAQKPALGYAFHPPMVAWLIGMAQAGLGWLAGNHSSGLVRLPAALCSAGMLTLAVRWVRQVQPPDVASTARSGPRLPPTFAVLVSFAGLFALSWMMVPDLPLFLGWTVAFTATWSICFRDARLSCVWLAIGVALAILSKFSGVLIPLSSGAAVLIWAPRERRWPALFALIVGGLAASLPILIWNANHEWASILYQIRDRHEGGGGISWVRYGRFWTVEAVAAGPALLAYAGTLFFRGGRNGHSRRITAYALVWMAPALVFCVQPLWAEFKPHWAFITWWPALLALAAECASGSELGATRRLAWFQLVWGWTLLTAVVIFCIFPVGGAFVTDPRLDVSNDLYGWADLPTYLRSLPGPLPRALVGARYQTSAQASFALQGEGLDVSFIPRDRKSLDEWPNLHLSDGQGPAWPRLLEPVLYVTDNRYDSGPEFPGASCAKLGRLEKLRGGKLAKWIEIWRCAPAASPS